MSRSEQAKRWDWDRDATEMAVTLEDVLGCIESAMDSMKGCEALAGLFSQLGDIYDETEQMYREYDAQAGKEYDEEVEALTRDYYRSVI